MVIMDYITEYTKHPTLIMHHVILVCQHTVSYIIACTTPFSIASLKCIPSKKHHIEASLDAWINEV